MKEQYLHKITSSFFLWIDNVILKQDAYVNTSTELFYTKDPLLHGYVTYSSPYKQWVSDSSIQGANIPSGIYVNDQFIGRGVSGLSIDFENGRVIFDENVGTGLTVSGEYAYKEMNVYMTPSFEQEIINEKANILDERFYTELSGIAPYNYALPAIFVTNAGITKNPWAFGGIDEASLEVKTVMMASDSYVIDGIISILNDQAYNNFCVFENPNSVLPYNEFCDLKSGYYNYTGIVDSENKNLGYISSVKVTRLTPERLRANFLSRNVKIALIDFNISYILFPNSQ